MNTDREHTNAKVQGVATKEDGNVPLLVAHCLLHSVHCGYHGLDGKLFPSFPLEVIQRAAPPH